MTDEETVAVCRIDGCQYTAEYDGYCKWCMHHMDRQRVEYDYPELSILP